MREIRTSGSEGGGAETNRRFLPLPWLLWMPAFAGMTRNRTTTGDTRRCFLLGRGRACGAILLVGEFADACHAARQTDLDVIA